MVIIKSTLETKKVANFKSHHMDKQKRVKMEQFTNNRQAWGIVKHHKA